MPAASHLIVSALVRRDEKILLVEEQGLDDPAPSWMLPGGKVEADESVLAALERELAEETGLRLIGAGQIAFAVEIVSAEGVYTAFTFDCHAQGSLAPADPDGLVRHAAWVPVDTALERLAKVGWYDCTFLARYLSGDAPAGSIHSVDRR